MISLIFISFVVTLTCARVTAYEATTQDYWSTTGASGVHLANHIRLVNGGYYWRGRLEVYHNGIWGTVCDDDFGTNEAIAVCNQLGYRNRFREPAAYQSAHFGEGSGPIYLDDVRCPDKYSHVELYQCTSLPWRSNNCGHEEDVSVDCFYEDTSTTEETATVTTENSSQSPGVYQAHSIRLVNGGHSWRGRLEVYHNGVWGTVCDDDFGTNEAIAVCTQLGYFNGHREPEAYSSARFGEGYGPIYLDDVRCPNKYSHVTLYECTSLPWGSNNCGHSEDVSVDCFYGDIGTTEETATATVENSSPSSGVHLANYIRLVNGGHYWRGRLEVYHHGVWGTVCDDGFGTNEAIAVCNQLGYHNRYREPAAYQNAWFGEGQGPIYLDDVSCPNKYSFFNFNQCTSLPWGSTDCGHKEDVSVDCFYGDTLTTEETATATVEYSTQRYGVHEAYNIRLVNGGHSWRGRLEVYHNGVWGTVCDDSFGTNEAVAVCNQLGYHDRYREPVAYQNAYFGTGYGPIYLDDVNCPDKYSHVKLYQCTSLPWRSNNCGHGEDVSVDCYPDDVTTTDSTVNTTMPENSTTDYGINEAYNIRLVDGAASSRGRLEVYHDGRWGTVCDDGFGTNEAIAVCNQLGYHSAYRTPVSYQSAYYGQGYGQIWLDSVSCPNKYAHAYFHDCTSQSWGTNDCSHSEDVSVNCYPEDTTTEGYTSPDTTTERYTSPGRYGVAQAYDIRLVNGGASHRGRLEVYHNGEWGSVCDDGFGIREARAVCNQLNYDSNSNPVAYSRAHYGEGYGRIWLDNVDCSNRYGLYYLTQCTSNPWGVNNCGHGEDVSVDCYGGSAITTEGYEVTSSSHTQVRLVGGYGYWEGRVEIYKNGQWGTVCANTFSENDAYVICKMLNVDYHRYPKIHYSSSYYGQGRGRSWDYRTNCHGYESDISQCWNEEYYYTCSHSHDIGINCQSSSGDYNPWYHATTEMSTSMRLSNGNHGRLEVFHNGLWGTVCDDGFGESEARVVCRYIGHDHYRNPTVYTYGDGYYNDNKEPIWLDDVSCNGYEGNLDECRSRGWGETDCGHKEDVGINCEISASTQTTESTDVATANYDYESAIHVGCAGSHWDVRVYRPYLYNRNRDYVDSDVYLGDESCPGYRSGDYLIFDQGYSRCLTRTTDRWGDVAYQNTLIYAKHDPSHPFILREYRFKIDLECVMTPYETVSQDILQAHTQYRNNHPLISGSGHYGMYMSFFTDRSFSQYLYGNPISARVGQELFVQVTTSVWEWEITMKVSNCYTLPSTTGSYQKYYLIRDGCAVDSGTRFISKTNHQTRFSFKDFEYSSNHDHLYVYCSARFCNTTADPYNSCDQRCYHSDRRSLAIDDRNSTTDESKDDETDDESNYILDTVEIVEVIKLTKHEIHKREAPGHTTRHHDNKPHLLYAVLTVLVVVGVVAITVLVLRHKSRKQSKEIENI